MASDPLATHRALYDALETGDIDLMRSLWVNDAQVTCVHPNAPVLRGFSAVQRAWAVLMANLGYIQFFLTDVELTFVGGQEDPSVAVIVCTENILTDVSSADDTSFSGGTAVATSVLVRHDGRWRFWSRHASGVGGERT